MPMTRTTSEYFSPNSAIAPRLIASSYFIVADERRMLGTSPGCASVDHSLDSGLGVSTVAQLGDTEAWIFETDPKAVRLNRLTAGFFEPIDHRVCSSISTPGRIGKPLAGRRTGDLGENQWGARIAAWVRRVPSPERTVRGSRRDRLGLPARWAHAAAAGRNEVS